MEEKMLAGKISPANHLYQLAVLKVYEDRSLE
jgi:hypothetical protein